MNRLAPRPADAPTTSPWHHIGAIDGLRALAVGAVLLFHGGHLDGGFLGVDLFFAVSGFLITSLLIRDADGPGIALTAFWGRRFRRLLPAVLALIAAVGVWVWAFGSASEIDGVRRTGPAALFYVANWKFIGETGGYWASFDQPSMFSHLWSLAIEEQFYFVWPLVVLAVWRWSRRPHATLLAVCALGAAASFVAMVALVDPVDPTRVYMGTDTRAASLLVGAAVAVRPARRVIGNAVRRLGGWLDVVLVAAIAAIGWSWLSVDGASSEALYRGGLLVHSAACALVVACLAAGGNGRIARLLAARPLHWVGVRSYGLYLWHWPVYVVMSPERMGVDGVALTAWRIAVSTALAAISFRVIEEPVRHRAAWARGRRAVPALAGAIAAVLLVLMAVPRPAVEIAAFDAAGVAFAPATTTTTTTATTPTAGTTATTHATSSPSTTAAPPSAPAKPASAGPAPDDGTTPLADAIALATTEAERDTDRFTAYATSAASATDAARAATRTHVTAVLWSGDSIAYDLAPGVTAAFGSAGVVAGTATHPGTSLAGTGNHSLIDKLPAALAATQPQVVILQLTVWDAIYPPAEQRAGFERLVALTLGSGAHLVVVSPPPTVLPEADAALEDLAAMARAAAAADPDHIFYLDPTPVWGTAFNADLDADGTPERKRDGVHVCPSGAARFGSWLVAELAVRFDGITPAPPVEWAADEWVADRRYDQPVGACAPLT